MKHKKKINFNQSLKKKLKQESSSEHFEYTIQNISSHVNSIRQHKTYSDLI